ncbi:MAG: DNA translocase FtsK [Minisyncoccota bacterium]
MGRKKKAEEKDNGFMFEDILHSDAKRSIMAVFLFALSLLFLLAYFDTAGVLGEWLDMGLGMLLGFGKWLLPLLLIIAGLLFLKRRTTTLADAVKFIGLAMSFISVLGILHVYSGDETSELWEVVKSGEGGGFIGFVLAYLLVNFTGKIAGTILLLALCVTGVIAAFNMSLIHFIERLQARLSVLRTKQKEEQSIQGHEETGIETNEKAEPVVIKSPAIVETIEAIDSLEAHNIRKMNFQNDVSDDEKQNDGQVRQKPTRPKQMKKHRVTTQWTLPSVDCLVSSNDQAGGGDIEHNKHIIQSTLKYFGIEVEPGEALMGPTVTRYTFRPAFGVKLSRITTLADDLALALAAQSIRIEAPIPGQSLIGIEVPNKKTATVHLRNIIEENKFQTRTSDLMLALGQDVAGKTVLADLRKMPHLLIAGRTGSGKSVCVNTLLLSLLYQNTPEDLRLILVDPKRVELSIYKGIPHLQTDVIVDMKKVVGALRWAVSEMEDRYKILEEMHARDIVTYRERVMMGEERTIVDIETSTVKTEPFKNLPYIVIVIDEMADLMSLHGKEVEALINRLAAKSRAIGIHLILATQRPEVTVITGLIKSNIPTRIAFQLKSQIDSRTILASSGAEKLLGNGDMLYSPSEGTEMIRIQGVFVSDDEVKAVTAFWRKQKEALHEDEIGGDLEIGNGSESISEAMEAMDTGGQEDDMYEQAKQLMIQTGKASTTSLQTVFGIGYPKAARLMHLLEENGVVGMVDGKKKVLLSSAVTTELDDEEKRYGDDSLTDQSMRDKWQL